MPSWICVVLVLTVPIVMVGVGWLLSRWNVQIRWNVLLLVGMGYLVITVLFGVLSYSNAMNSQQAYEIVQAPLIALIGGSLAIAKDLVNPTSKTTPYARARFAQRADVG